MGRMLVLLVLVLLVILMMMVVVIVMRTCLDTMQDEYIRRRFRLSRQAIIHLYALIEERLRPTTGRSHAVPGMVKLLATLYILGRGSFQTISGIICGLGQPTVSRVFTQAILAIKSLAPRFVHFPQTEREWRDVKLAFYNRAGFPNILGAVDCTHIALQPPRLEERTYRNRKQYHCLNVQIVHDATQKIMSVRANFPGSTLDAFILRQSGVSRRFERGQFPHGWLVGDAGYPQHAWLMAPIRYPQLDTTVPAEARYNSALRRTRAVVETTIGLLKARFLCLARPGGELLYSPRKCARIILVCCILHNLCRERHESWHMNEEMEPEIIGALLIVIDDGSTLLDYVILHLIYIVGFFVVEGMWSASSDISQMTVLMVQTSFLFISY
ncbi:PREDICTED: putative nuclease HARBI1 [Nanorana parkeri]|uniref:putative nuclease HARBI1 n=1 Tax=Nanorana parkeri TaxID=125878 RepID=UPI000854420A|nr:PREDICTED: putative nuclease HARBI1 [Nanorana parkeri]